MVEQNTVNICIDVQFILRALNVNHLNYIINKNFIFNYINLKFLMKKSINLYMYYIHKIKFCF